MYKDIIAKGADIALNFIVFISSSPSVVIIK